MYSTKRPAIAVVAILTLILTACGTGATPAATETTIVAQPSATTAAPAATETSVPTTVPATSVPATAVPTETSAPTTVPPTSAPATTAPTTQPTVSATSPAIATATTAATPMSNGQGDMTRIEFAPNTSTASVSGEVGGTVTKSYLLEASAGQFMVMSVTSPNNNVYLTLVAPDGSPLARAQNGVQEVNLELPQSGDYRITVSTPSDQPLTSFSLDMLVTFEQTSIQHFRRIQFAPNATEATATGTITARGADQYLIEASAGQQFVASVDNGVFFSLVSPSGDPLARAQNGTQSVDLILPESGDYTILIAVPQETPDTSYTFTVSILSTPTVTPIQFEAGGTETTVTSYTQEGTFPRYTFEALAGQTARVSITSEGDVANWGLTAPDGTPIKRVASETRSAEFELPINGEYSISIGSPTAGVSFQLTLEILPPS